MKPFTLIRPATLSEAAREAAKPSSELKAGGVDLLDRLKEGFDSPQRVVSIAHMPGLDEISAGPPAKIGALATLARISSSADLKRIYPALADAAEGAATPQIRNMATLGGNLCQRPRCWYYRLAEFDCRKKGGATCYAQDGENRFHAIFDSDLFCCCLHPSATAVALLAYGAKLNTVSPRGRRTIALDNFFVRPIEDALRENVLASGEIIETVTIPAPPPGARSIYRKLKEKESFDWPLVEVCVNLTVSGGTVGDARVILGSVAPTPHRSPEAEAVLRGAKAGPEIAARAAQVAVSTAKPLAQNAFRVRLARVTLERALREILA
ncbi:MAG TPA: FAD binding domain-containing protein [Thermoanaerobaculia bacterium]|nr:FAD binding domain-containing protein [Thermoanaerobaculia bacterium]